MSENNFDVIIIGGSYSGLAAGMCLGRALKKVLVIDSGKPCNRQTPHSHNFLTNDGREPAAIAAIAREQVAAYKTIQFFDGTVVQAARLKQGFRVTTNSVATFHGTYLVFATGIKDLLPEIDGLEACWGISVIHCPYCHGYEVRGVKTAILGNGEPVFDFARMVSNWTADLTVFTNGASKLTSDQQEHLSGRSIMVLEKEIEKLEHKNGHLQNLVFKDGSRSAIPVLYAPSPFEQHCKIPQELGCELTEEGYIKTDASHATTIPGVYAVGDNSSKLRTVANAVSTGTSVGIVISKKMIFEGHGDC